MRPSESCRYWCMACALMALLSNSAGIAPGQFGDLPKIVPNLYAVRSDNPNLQNELEWYVQALAQWYAIGIKEVCFIFQEAAPSIYPALMERLENANMPDVHVIPGRATQCVFLCGQGQIVCGWTDPQRWQTLADDMQGWMEQTGEISCDPPRFMLDVEFVYHSPYGCLNSTCYHWCKYQGQ